MYHANATNDLIDHRFHYPFAIRDNTETIYSCLVIQRRLQPVSVDFFWKAGCAREGMKTMALFALLIYRLFFRTLSCTSFLGGSRNREFVHPRARRMRYLRARVPSEQRNEKT